MNFTLQSNLVDVHQRLVFPAEITIAQGKIEGIRRIETARGFILPGFVDSHIHIESSMLLPSEFARVAVIHGTVATVSDPHEIANVCGMAGIELMLRNAAQTGFKFCFGAPSCVPATGFETAGATLDSKQVLQLLEDPRIGYLSEVMNFPGVLNGDPEVIAKIEAAKKMGKPIDGHAPGLRGDDAVNYIRAGITTDHECYSKPEALEKIAAGCKIAIREGSAARNFAALQSLIDEFPADCMFCSDDKHPDELLMGHIDRLVARAIGEGRELMNVLQVACVNPVNHYGLDVGLLRVGDPADFILVEDLVGFKVLETYLDGVLVAKDGDCRMPAVESESINRFDAGPIKQPQLQIKAASERIRVIKAIDGQLVTQSSVEDCKIDRGFAVSDTARDILKIAVVNRYADVEPALGFVSGFGLKTGAFASSVAHDSHNVIAVGTNDLDLQAAINAVIEQRGGLAVVDAGEQLVLPLAVAGLISMESCEAVASRYSLLDRKVKQLGSQLRAPFMTLSFMALLVIPSLKISDRGLFDGSNFEFVSLFVDRD
ncbi:MAG: adenine deaminase [Mariniblastus sp.]|nr:adenine deaminase [Mariniblastus sp.]